MFFSMAELSVGQSAAGRWPRHQALAPFVIAAWMAGICDAAVAAVPLVSVPFSPSCLQGGERPAGLDAV